MDRRTLAIFLVIAGIAGLAYITSKGSTLFYVENTTAQQPYIQPGYTQEVNSKVVGGSLQLTGKIYYYSYQQKEAEFVGQVLQQYGVDPIGIKVDTSQGQALFQQLQSIYHVPSSLPIVQIGSFVFVVYPTYVYYATCPGDIKYINIGDKSVIFCEYNGEFILNAETLAQLVNACKTTQASSCYN